MAVLRAVLLFLLICYCSAYVTIINPNNVRLNAEEISPSADIQETVIHFWPGTGGEILLSIPFYIDKGVEQPSFVIILGIDNEWANNHDSDLKIGVTDGEKSIYFWIPDAGDYCNYSPCFPMVPHGDDTLVSGEVPRTFKMTVHPTDRYGYCETAHEGGYSNVGKFDEELDTSKEKMSLLLIRDGYDEEYFIRYITIEVTSLYK